MKSIHIVNNIYFTVLNNMNDNFCFFHEMERYFSSSWTFYYFMQDVFIADIYLSLLQNTKIATYELINVLFATRRSKIEHKIVQQLICYSLDLVHLLKIIKYEYKSINMFINSCMYNNIIQ